MAPEKLLSSAQVNVPYRRHDCFITEIKVGETLQVIVSAESKEPMVLCIEDRTRLNCRDISEFKTLGTAVTSANGFLHISILAKPEYDNKSQIELKKC